MNLRSYSGRRVLVTGHTGFKGAWLAAWLETLGAQVFGLSLPATPAMQASWSGLDVRYPGKLGDIRDAGLVQQAVRETRPDIVFHLAAQALVRASYRNPVDTFATNVMGTTHVLEAARLTPSVQAVVVITSDKCYANREWHWGYREDEPMGGHDPYSASKGCAELVTDAYRSSFELTTKPPYLASARAGNVIGGGDWAEDRLVPDLIRGLRAGEPIVIRRPRATRPWQHVLEPLSGYLLLGASLLNDGPRWSAGWNFGPFELQPMPVGELAQHVVNVWGEGELRIEPEESGPHEARFLKLDSSKALNELGWRPLLTPPERVIWSVDWYRTCAGAPRTSWIMTRSQIEEYTERMKRDPAFGPAWLRRQPDTNAA